MRMKSKYIQTRKEEAILFLLTDNTIVYVENIKVSTKNLLELRESSKVKIRLQKSILFLYLSNWKIEIETKCDLR